MSPDAYPAATRASWWPVGRWRRHDSGICCGCGQEALTCSLEALTEAERTLQDYADRNLGKSGEVMSALSIIRAARRPILDTRAAFRYESLRPDENDGESEVRP